MRVSSYDLSKGGRLTGMTYPDVRVLSCNYDGSTLDDAIGRLGSISDGSGLLEGFSYLGHSTVIERTRGNGVNLTYIGTGPGDGGDQYVGLDRFGRIVDHNWTNGSTSLDRYTYTYDRNSNRTAKNNVLNAQFNESYTYDTLNRLTSFTRTNGREQLWDLDALGNWQTITTDGVSESRSHNAQNQLTGIDDGTTQTPLGYDANGNVTIDHNGHTLIYDAWNRLVAVKDGLTTLQRYEHDALKRRIVENAHAATPTVLYYSAGWQVIEEREDGIPTAQYVWSPVYVDAMILRDRDANANPADALEQRHYVQHDANFNVTAITGPAGTVAQRYLYDPYGQATVLAANWQPTTGNHDWQYLHQGGRYDPATTLHHFRNRDYSAELGRWVQQDPHPDGPYVDGMQTYLLEGANPSSRVDPWGLDFITTSSDGRYAVWVPEGLFGRNLNDEAVPVGWIDSHGVAWINGRPIPMEILEDLDGGSYSELLAKIVKAQQDAFRSTTGFTNGFSHADYFDLRVTAEECRRLFVEAAEQRCVEDIMIRAATLAGSEGLAAAWQIGAGATAGIIGGAVILGASGPVGWTAGVVILLGGGAIAADGVMDAADVHLIRQAGEVAVKLYCNCECYQ